MHKEDASQTAFAFIMGATVGAGVALLFASRAGSGLRSSLGQSLRRVTDQVDQAIEQVKESTVMPGQPDTGGFRTAGSGCAVRSGQRDHTEGDTGHDN